MSPSISLFDHHGNFATEVLQQQAKKIRDTCDVIAKAQELNQLQGYFLHLGRLTDPHDGAMVELWPSGLFEEVVEILSTPMDPNLVC